MVRRGCHALWRRIPNALTAPWVSSWGRASVPWLALQPRWRKAWLLGTPAVWASPRFVRHYYGGRSLFHRLLRCFSWPGSLHEKWCQAQSLTGCPIRTSRDLCVLAAPPRISLRCHVLHRHEAPGHPPCAGSVFFAHTFKVDVRSFASSGEGGQKPFVHSSSWLLDELCTW